jgi:hypothetical protein
VIITDVQTKSTFTAHLLSDIHLIHQVNTLRTNIRNNRISVNRIYVHKTDIINKYLNYFSVFKKCHGEERALSQGIITPNVVGSIRDGESSKRKLTWKVWFK